MSHAHRWMFLQVKMSFEPQENGFYKQVEYAYLICNGCEQVMKRRIKSEQEIEDAANAG